MILYMCNFGLILLENFDVTKMNKKSIFGILILVLALSLTLGAVSAEDVAIDGASDVIAADESVEVQTASVDEVGQAAGGEISELATADTAMADVGVVVTPLLNEENCTVWSVFAYNNGPDNAENARVLVGYSDNLDVYGYYALSGEFDYENGIWYLGEMPAYEYTELLLNMEPIAYGPYFVAAAIASDTIDPYQDNNFDVAFMGLEGGEEASAAEETLPATGNPLAMALLALLAVGVGGVRRLF